MQWATDAGGEGSGSGPVAATHGRAARRISTVSRVRPRVLEGRPLPAYEAVDRGVRIILKSNVNSRVWRHARGLALFVVFSLLMVREASALDPHKGLTQYSRTTWTQEHGLPQDAIRA